MYKNIFVCICFASLQPIARNMAFLWTYAMVYIVQYVRVHMVSEPATAYVNKLLHM